jgi:hypothetical protein
MFLQLSAQPNCCEKRINTSDQIDDWRRDLKAKLTWALVVKLLGLILLWLLFFRGHAS